MNTKNLAQADTQTNAKASKSNEIKMAKHKKNNKKGQNPQQGISNSASNI